jgi:hypothetical protein
MPPDFQYGPDPELLAAVLAELPASSALPSLAQLREMVDKVFWASVSREEGRGILASCAYVGDETRLSYQFARPVPFTVDELMKLSPALPQFQAVAVARHENGGLGIRGLVAVGENVRVSTIAPALLMLHHLRPLLVYRRTGVSRLRPRARDEARELLACARLEGELGERRARNVLLRLAAAIARERHGGTLLIVPGDDASWRAVVETSHRDAGQPFRQLADALRSSYLARVERDEAQRNPDGVHPSRLPDIAVRAHEAYAFVATVIDQVARLANVDGALLVDGELNVLSFGSKIAARKPLPSVRVRHVELDQADQELPLGQIGGMRHQSAAKFVHELPAASAIVISHDGPISIFTSSGRQVVQLKGIEYLTQP